MGEIKTGQYGHYFEYEQDGQIKRLSLPSDKITVQMAEQLVEGKTIIYRKNTFNTFYRKPFMDGYVEIEASLRPYINKQGKETQIVSERQVRVVKDIPTVMDAVTKNPPTEGQSMNEYVSKINNLLSGIDTASKWCTEFRYHGDSYDRERLYYLYVCIKGDEGGLTRVSPHVVNYDSGEILKNLDETEELKFKQKCKEYRDELNRIETEEAREKAKQERDKRVAEIRAQDWEEVTIKDYEENPYVDAEDIRKWLQDNVENKNIETIVLFKHKTLSVWINDSHRTIEDRSKSDIAVAYVLPAFPIEFIKENWAYPLQSVSVEIASDYYKDIEPDTTYIVKCTLHGTD